MAAVNKQTEKAINLFIAMGYGASEILPIDTLLPASAKKGVSDAALKIIPAIPLRHQ
jgi:hypothetical protein